MGNFSEKLTQIIVGRKISVGDVVFGADISRNAFFKYKSGSRLPASREIVERIADSLGSAYIIPGSVKRIDCFSFFNNEGDPISSLKEVYYNGTLS